jgi:hypothetical protein
MIRRLGASLFAHDFSFGGESRLKSVITGAGCRDVEVAKRIHKIVFPNEHILIQMSLLGSPAVLQLSEISRRDLLDIIDALIGDLTRTTDQYTSHGSIIVPVSLVLGRAKP